MCERVDGKVGAVETPIGYMPKKEDFDMKGLDLSTEAYEELMTVEVELFKKSHIEVEEFFNSFGDKYPERLKKQLDAMKERIEKASGCKV